MKPKALSGGVDVVVLLAMAGGALFGAQRMLSIREQPAPDPIAKVSRIQATATANEVNKIVVNYKITNSGSGYATAPKVAITDATGSGAAAVATVAGGVVTAITRTNADSGYSDSPS